VERADGIFHEKSGWGGGKERVEEMNVGREEGGKKGRREGGREGKEGKGREEGKGRKGKLKNEEGAQRMIAISS
jgi:hypothetical protein